MIVAIEGPSAAGKTTWCRSHCQAAFVEEASPDIAGPDLYGDPIEVANFWVDFNVNQWQAALQLERQKGVAFCDGDPFHLYFSWSLWKAGALPRDLFDAELRLYRRALEQGRIGFADFVFWQEVPVEELRRRAKSDATHCRRRRELYLSLLPWMRAWFTEREETFPGTLRAWPDPFRVEELSGSRDVSRRYDTAALDRMIGALQLRAN